MSGDVLREPGVERCEHVDVCEHACRMWCRAYKPRVDRDALLELADEMQRELDECESDHEIVGKLQYQIDRIHEACGECSKAVRDGGRLTCDAWAQWDGTEWQRPETEAEGFCWKGETDADRQRAPRGGAEAQGKAGGRLPGR